MFLTTKPSLQCHEYKKNLIKNTNLVPQSYCARRQECESIAFGHKYQKKMRISKGKQIYLQFGPELEREKLFVSLHLACSTDNNCIEEMKTARKCTHVDLSMNQVIRTVGDFFWNQGSPFPVGESQKSLLAAFRVLVMALHWTVQMQDSSIICHYCRVFPLVTGLKLTILLPQPPEITDMFHHTSLGQKVGLLEGMTELSQTRQKTVIETAFSG